MHSLRREAGERRTVVAAASMFLRRRKGGGRTALSRRLVEGRERLTHVVVLDGWQGGGVAMGRKLTCPATVVG